MIFATNESLEDSIIRLLSDKSASPQEIYELILSEGKNPSIQAVYKAIRSLTKASVIVKSGKYISISREWSEKFIALLASPSSLPPLAEGESVSYSYNSLVNLDAYWKHLMKSLEERYSGHPAIIYNPFGIWLHLAERLRSETDYLNAFEREKRYGFLVIGNGSVFDAHLKQSFQNDYLQIDTWQKSSFKTNEYFTVIGDYVITTKIGEKLHKKILDFYKNSSTKENASALLNKLLQTPDKAKIKLEHTTKKAKALRKQLLKNFYLPREVKEALEYK